MRSISGLNWGAHPEVLLRLYKSTIRAVLEYGAIAFEHLSKTHRIRLQRIQWRALRTSLGLLSSTHTGSLEALAGVPPLDLRWRYLSDKHSYKSLGSPSLLLRSSLHRLQDICHDHVRIRPLRDILPLIETPQKFPCYSYPLREVMFIPLVSWYMRDVLASAHNPSATVIKSAFNDAMRSEHDTTAVYTDGSQSSGKTGSAIFVDELTYQTQRLQEPASVFDAELAAVFMAIEFIESRLPNSFHIISDSMSVLMALQNNAITAKSSWMLIKCRCKLALLADNNFQITLMWVPAHSGIDGNERADELAKMAISEETTVLSPFQPVWTSHLISLKKLYHTQWQQRWDSGDLGRFCYSIIPKIKPIAWFVKFDGPLDRSELRTALRIVSNHYTLNNHLNRFAISDSPLCQCGAYETVDHILFQCQIHSLHRNILSNQLHKDGLHTFNTRYILSITSSSDTIKCIHEFLKKNNVKL